jgi:hypothetical protein
MKKIQLNQLAKCYPYIFSIGVLALLVSFIPITQFQLSTLSTNFRWRKEMIVLFSSLRMRMGDRVYNDAIIGKDGWFFFTGEQSILNYQNTELFHKKTLRSLQKQLDQLNTDLANQGITLLVVIAPNKSTVYSQFMPNEIPIIGKTSRLDQFVDYMKAHGQTRILDLSPALIQASRSRDVYYKTDTHWNDLGAYYAYAEIMNTLSSVYPDLVPYGRSEFVYKDMGPVTMDISQIMGLKNYKEEVWSMLPTFEIPPTEDKILQLSNGDLIHFIANPNSDGAKLIVFHDSFYYPLEHFLKPHFREIVSVPFSQSKAIWSLNWINHSSPDIVMIELAERYLEEGLSTLLGSSVSR